MKLNNKGRRQQLSFLKWKKRLRRQAALWNGDKTIDLIKQNAYKCYRTTSTPCSCWLCSLPKYERHKQKVEIRRLIAESLDWKYAP